MVENERNCDRESVEKFYPIGDIVVRSRDCDCNLRNQNKKKRVENVSLWKNQLNRGILRNSKLTSNFELFDLVKNFERTYGRKHDHPSSIVEMRYRGCL